MTNSDRRYDRQIMLAQFGDEGQRRLKAGRVIIIGVGGLGCPAAQYLCAAGVGQLCLVDADKVSLPNLQREILYTTADVGLAKVDLAAARLAELNPDCKFVTCEERLSNLNAVDLISDYDIVLDCTDNLPTRYQINEACIAAQKPLVQGSVRRFEGTVASFDAARGPCYECLFPRSSTREITNPPKHEGVMGVLAGVIGTLQATEAIKMLAGIGLRLDGRMIKYDALKMSFEPHRFAKDPHCCSCAPKSSRNFAE